MQETDTMICPTSRQEWREWLEENHVLKQSVWLVYYKKQSDVPSVRYQEAVEEALCFGWIDGVKKKLDDARSVQYFCKRKPKSVWSKINKEKVQCLINDGLMTPAGLNCIEIAQANGSWTILDEVEELKVPDDLAKELKNRPGAETYFAGLSKSVRKAILQWLILAKRPETRQKRVDEIAGLAAEGLRPPQFR